MVADLRKKKQPKGQQLEYLLHDQRLFISPATAALLSLLFQKLATDGRKTACGPKRSGDGGK